MNGRGLGEGVPHTEHGRDVTRQVGYPKVERTYVNATTERGVFCFYSISYVTVYSQPHTDITFHGRCMMCAARVSVYIRL